LFKAEFCIVTIFKKYYNIISTIFKTNFNNITVFM
jgi:hypothetical protein